MRRTFLLSMAGLLCTGFASAADESLPKPEDLFNKFIDVTGGRAAYEKRKNEVTTGTMEFVGKGIKGTLTAYADASNNVYSVVDLEGIGKVEQGVYKGTPWESSAIQGTRIKDGAEKADAIRDATFNSELKWREMYPKAEVAGVEDLDGAPAYKLILTPADGKPQTLFFDKKSGLMVKRMSTAVTSMGEMPVEMTISDYKKVGDLMRPTKVLQKAMGMEFAITMDDFQTNVDIPKERFEPPAEVKKLMEKAAPAAAPSAK